MLIYSEENIMNADNISSGTMRVLEFFSGIGGTHFALQGKAAVVAAFDINTTANAIYRHNFPSTTLRQSNIQNWTRMMLTYGQCRLLVSLTPGLGDADRRSDSFFSLISSMIEMKHPPRFLFLENVVGFETSSTHEWFLDVLIRMGYHVEQFILCPTQFGIANQRPRFYLLATKSESGLVEPILHSLPGFILTKKSKIGAILEIVSSQDLIVTANELNRHGHGMDVVCESSTRSSCFTKSYGGYAIGCGSFYCDLSSLVQNDRARLVNPETAYPHIRRFGEREVARLMSFPEEFSLPAETTRRQAYKCLGNSVNVAVVRALLERLLCTDSITTQ